LGRVAGVVAGAIGVAMSMAASVALAQPKAAQQQTAKITPFDVCKGLTGADAAGKIAGCTEALKDGKLAPIDQASAYLNRGMAESGPGSDVRSKADFRAAIRIYNELILGSPMNPYYYLQRGTAYQTIGGQTAPSSTSATPSGSLPARPTL
jgi:hypothetical protein